MKYPTSGACIPWMSQYSQKNVCLNIICEHLGTSCMRFPMQYYFSLYNIFKLYMLCVCVGMFICAYDCVRRAF